MPAAHPTSTFEASGPGSVFGKYRITGKLGTGGMGIVFAAEHQRLGRRVAIKLLKPEFSSDPMQARRFQAEARLISRIGHPNIVEVYDFGQLPDGSLYFVMELLEGVTLRQRLMQRPLSDAEIIAVFVPLIAAVQTAHAIGVVHRDLKPDNVMLVPSTEPEAPLVKLMDFGVAKIRGENATSSMVTESGVIMGTPAYMAPEQVRASSKVDGRADIYAIGVMLYEVLCGERPFRGPLPALLAAQMFDEAPRPSSVAGQRGLQRPQIDWPQMDRVVQKAMAKDASARHPDCGALLQDLRATSANLRASSFLPTLNRPMSTVVSGGPLLSTLLTLPLRQRYVVWAAAALLFAGSLTGALLYRRAIVNGGSNGGLQNKVALVPTGDAVARARSLVMSASRGNPVERRELLLALASARSSGQRAFVMASLLDPQPAVWRAAVQAAAAVARPKDEELGAALRTLSARATGPSAVDVALARLTVGDSAAEAMLRSALNGAALDPESRLRAAMALTESGQLSLAELRAVVAREVRASAVRPGVYRTAMARLLRQGDKETQRRVSAALRSDQLPLQREAAEILARAGQSAGRDKLWTLSRAATGNDQLELAALLAELDEPRAAEPLLALLADPSPVVRQRAAGALGALSGDASAIAKDGLARLIADSDPQVAVTAAVALLKGAEPAGGSKKLSGDGR